MQTLRFADEKTVQHYPLHIPGPVDWHPVTGGWQAIVPMPDIPARSIITPSLSILNEPDYRYRFTLRTGKKEYALNEVPPQTPDANKTTRSANGSDSRIRTAIDCYHTAKKATRTSMLFSCQGSALPERYLLTISIRPEEMKVDPPGELPAVRTPLPPTHSQMLENPRIANRVCSPVSTAMVLGAFRQGVNYQSVIDACFDPVTRMYGMWPLAIRAASRQGCIGAVELISDWSDVIACLTRGYPVVASIRYGSDELPGTPQRSTGGHLVVVHGIVQGGSAGQEVLVNDPAAPNHGTVTRRYPLDAFSKAWFRYRGAAYILTP
jgi:hypothetical protein